MATKYAIFYGQFGPYHHARVAALQHSAASSGVTVLPVQLGSETRTYHWQTEGASIELCDGLETLCEGEDEDAPPLEVFKRARTMLRQAGIELAFIPSYWPPRILALLLAAKSAGIPTVMMNESHAGTARATGWKRWVKHRVVRSFDAAIVGGETHRRYFAAIGLPAKRIFTGVDAVDNQYFGKHASAERESQHFHGLPERYFLSLGRMVEKKNLEALVVAYKSYVDRSLSLDQRPAALVFVGSGNQEVKLRLEAKRLGLTVIDATTTELDPLKTPRERVAVPRGTVYFFGFRQIWENPIFYAHADAFVLPSIREEWGLVVNEAMASGLPVIVSRTAGCAEELVPRGDALKDAANRLDRDALERRENGYIFDPSSPSALAEALFETWKLDPSARQRMGHSSLKIVAKYDCANFAANAMLAANAAVGHKHRSSALGGLLRGRCHGQDAE